MTWAIHTGDCLRILQDLPSDHIAAVITDPPYSSGGAMRSDRMASTGRKYTLGGTLTHRTDFAGDNRDQRSYGYWSALWLGEALRVTKPGGVCLLFTDWRQLPVTCDALQAGGWIWRGIVPWDKTESARPDKGRFRNQCEYVVWGSKGPLGLAPSDAPCLPGVVRSRVLRSDKHHIAGKPTDVMRSLVRIAWQGGTILDPFCGSGTTGVAALLAGLDFIGCEAVPEYAERARERCAAAAATAAAEAAACPAVPAVPPAGGSPTAAAASPAAIATQTLLWHGDER
jgi:site-specific DNA-methyltransferase (adenine-specific)